jgi:hypothetical protein
MTDEPLHLPVMTQMEIRATRISLISLLEPILSRPMELERTLSTIYTDLGMPLLLETLYLTESQERSRSQSLDLLSVVLPVDFG